MNTSSKGEKEIHETHDAALQLEGKKDFNSPGNDLSCATGSGLAQCGRPCWEARLGRRRTLPHRTVPEDQDKERDRPDIPLGPPFLEYNQVLSPYIFSVLFYCLTLKAGLQS